jgi:diguanylate cyclase (GGDEF)-like protein
LGLNNLGQQMNDQSNTPPVRKSWLVDSDAAPQKAPPNLAMQIMNIMEQGIIVWSAEGVCEMHNTRIYDVLELSGEDIGIGTERSKFLDLAETRGEFDAGARKTAGIKFDAHKPFSYDLNIPSGRIVSTNARPSRGGGYVVTFTDVTEARRVAQKLAKAIDEAAESEARAHDVLQKERRRQKEAEMLGRLDEWLQSCKTLTELFEIVRTFMAKLLPQTRGELLVYSNSRDVLESACNWAQPAALAQMAPDGCWALRRGRSYQFEPNALSFLCDHVRGQGHKGDAPYICVPIIAHGDTVGLLHIQFDLDRVEHDILDPQSFAMRCGEHISMAIANVKLRDELHAQSVRDPLTGLYNRRFFMDAMRRFLGPTPADDMGVGLISFDADKFKLFNDNHGHDAGDVVLQAISEKVLEVIATDAVACRMGGEEFAVIAPNCTFKATVDLAEQIRAGIAATQVRYVHGALPRVTISAGVSFYPTHGTSPQVLLKQADEALYAAKAKGRNCVVVAKKS